MDNSTGWITYPEIRTLDVLSQANANATHEDIFGQRPGVFLGVGKDEAGKPVFWKDSSDGHILLVAPTRREREASLCVPACLSWNGSLIVNDHRKTLFNLTAWYRKNVLKQRVFCVDLFGTDESTTRLNPLDWVRLRTDHEVDDAQNLANMVLDPLTWGVKSDESAEYVRRTAAAFLTGVILHVLYDPDIKDKSLTGINTYLSSPGRPLLSTLDRMVKAEHDPNHERGWLYRGGPMETCPTVVTAAQDMLSKHENERNEVMSALRSYFELYRSSIVARNTSASNFSIEDLVYSDRPVTVYLNTDPGNLEQARPFMRWLYGAIIMRLTESRMLEHDLLQSRHRYKLLILANEFVETLGNLPILTRTLGVLGDYGIKFFSTVQNLAQLSKTYGTETAKVILGNMRTQIYFANNDLDTALHVSKMLGDVTLHPTSTWWNPCSWESSYSGASRSQPLLTPDAVRRLDEGKEIVIIAGHAPALLDRIVYDTLPEFDQKVHRPIEFDGSPLRCDVIPQNQRVGTLVVKSLSAQAKDAVQAHASRHQKEGQHSINLVLQKLFPQLDLEQPAAEQIRYVQVLRDGTYNGPVVLYTDDEGEGFYFQKISENQYVHHRISNIDTKIEDGALTRIVYQDGQVVRTEGINMQDMIHAAEIPSAAQSELPDIIAMDRAIAQKARVSDPSLWAFTQKKLGDELQSLGISEDGTTHLKEAIEAYDAALEEYTYERAPREWIATRNGLGTALQHLGIREKNEAILEKAVITHLATLEECKRVDWPREWAETKVNLGHALYFWGIYGTTADHDTTTERLRRAEDAYRFALEEYTREQDPIRWARIQNCLGITLCLLGRKIWDRGEGETLRIEQSVEAHRAALQENTLERDPIEWAWTQKNLGEALRTLGECKHDSALLEQSAKAYRAALEKYTQQQHPLEWKLAHIGLESTLKTLGAYETETTRTKSNDTDDLKYADATATRLFTLRDRRLDTISLRPTTREEVIGQDEALEEITGMLCSTSPAHILLFGPPGVGKTTIARLALELAKAQGNNVFPSDAPFITVDGATLHRDEYNSISGLTSRAEEGFYGSQSRVNEKRKQHEDTPRLMFGPMAQAHLGVLFIDEIGALDPKDQAALLKTLEDHVEQLEPRIKGAWLDDPRTPVWLKTLVIEGIPASFVLIGATTYRPEKLNAALRSRCEIITLRALNESDRYKIAAQVAGKIGIVASEEALTYIATTTTTGRDAARRAKLAGYHARRRQAEKIEMEDVTWQSNETHIGFR